MTGADAYVADQLFATLDTTLRKVYVPGADADRAVRHRRLHPRPAARPGRRVPRDAGRGRGRRPAAARDRRVAPRIATSRSRRSTAVLAEIGAADGAADPRVQQDAISAGLAPGVERDGCGTISTVRLSALTGAGCAELRAALAERFPSAGHAPGSGGGSPPNPATTRRRVPLDPRPPAPIFHLQFTTSDLEASSCRSTIPNGASAGTERRAAGSRRDLAQRQPPHGRALRPQAAATTPAAAATARRAAASRWAAPACWSRSSLLVWLASGFYIVDEGRRGVVTHFGKYTETTLPGPRWHLPFPIEAVELVDFSQVQDGRDRLPQFHAQEQGRQGSGDADRGREHHRHPVRGPIQHQERRSLRLQQPQARRDGRVRRGDGDPRGRRQAPRWTSRCTKAASRSRSRREKIMQETLDRYKTGVYIQKVTLQNVQPPDKVQAAFDDAVKAGAGPRAPRQRRPGLRERRRAARARHGVAAHGRGQRLQHRGHRRSAEGDASRFQSVLIGVREGARRHARPPVPRHDAVGARQLDARC